MHRLGMAQGRKYCAPSKYQTTCPHRSVSQTKNKLNTSPLRELILYERGAISIKS